MRRFLLLQAAIAFVFATSLQAQRAYIQHFQALADTLVLEQVMSLEKNNPDSALSLGLASSSHYLQGGDTLRGIFAFIYANYYGAGSSPSQHPIALMLNFVNDTAVWRDTISIHYGALLTSIGRAHKIANQKEIGLAYYVRASNIQNALAEPIPIAMQAELHKSIGRLYLSLGHTHEGLKHLTLAIELLDTLESQDDLAQCYLELAATCKGLGQVVLAFDLKMKSLEIFRKHFPGSPSHITAASGLSHLSLTNEDYEGALYWSSYTDSLFRSHGFRDSLNMIYTSIIYNRGVALRYLNQYQQAREALELLVETAKHYDNRPMLATAYIEMANLLAQLNELTEAMRYAQLAKGINPLLPEAFDALGRIANMQADYSSSVTQYSRALSLLAGVKDTTSAGFNLHAAQFDNISSSYTVASSLAGVLYKRHKQQGCKQSLRDAYTMVSLTDSLFGIQLHSPLTGVHPKRVVNDYRSFYGLAYRVISAINLSTPSKTYLEQLIYIDKRSKALGQTHQFTLSNRLNLPDSLRMLQHETLLRVQLLEFEHDIRESKGERISSEHREQLLDARLNAFAIALKAQQAPQKPPVDSFCLATFQESMHPKQAIIAYQQFDTLLFALLVTNREVQLVESRLPVAFGSMLSDYYRSLTLADEGYKDVGHQLFNVLIKPFGDNLLNFSHLHIITDGVLSHIPFEALWIGNGFLLQEHQVSYGYLFPSMGWSNRLTLPPNPTFLGVAPAFGHNQNMNPDMLKVFSHEGGPMASKQLDGRNRLINLHYAPKEVETLAKLFSSEGHTASRLMGNMATEGQFRQQANGFTVLHMATHGVSSGRIPELSGLFLAMSDKSSATANDGFLHLGEFYSIGQTPQLVALSASQSGADGGQVGRGMCLPRGMVTAGVNNVVASLWKVHDESTKMLMELFYKQLLVGYSYAEALRIAKLESIARGFQPFDWAGFVLIGR